MPNDEYTMPTLENDHPDDLELDLLRTDEASDETVRHVAACAQCQAALLELTLLAAAMTAAPKVGEGDAEPVAWAADLDRNMATTILAEGTTLRGQLRLHRLRRVRRAVQAMAAVLVLAGGATLWALTQRGTSTTEVAVDAATPSAVASSDAAADFAPTDLNRDGITDVVDAYLAARRLRDASGPDVNGDGRGDQADVDAILALAVRVGGEGSGS